MLARGAFSDPATVETLTGLYTPIVIDVDADRRTAERYRIRSLPSVVFADEDGQAISMFVGALPGVEVERAAERARATMESRSRAGSGQ